MKQLYAALAALNLCFIAYVAWTGNEKHDYWNDILFGTGFAFNWMAVLGYCLVKAFPDGKDNTHPNK